MAANLATLALECWFIGMGGGVLVGRLTQFILAACFFVGRTDVPFLSKDVSLFGYSFDYVPTNFIRDILVHEAHRHPFLERLLGMYLMKLKNEKFSNEAGACWRQLFVVTLMPWMIKLRVFSDRRLEAVGLEQYNARRLEHMSSLSHSAKILQDLEQLDVKYHWETQSILDEVAEEGEMEDEEAVHQA